MTHRRSASILRPMALWPRISLLGMAMLLVPHVAQAKKKAPAPAAGAAAESTPARVPSDPPAGSSPLEDLKASHASLKKLLAKQPPSWSPEKDAAGSDVRKLVNQFLDFEELAHRSLNKHWDTITPAQRKEFVSTLRELVERSYLKQIHGSPTYDLRFEREEKNGREAKVFAQLNTVSRGKKVQVAMEYHLLYKGSWVVYDLLTDDQSLLETYRAEFNKIISKESFDALLKRMKKKLEEKPEDKVADKAGGKALPDAPVAKPTP